MVRASEAEPNMHTRLIIATYAWQAAKFVDIKTDFHIGRASFPDQLLLRKRLRPLMSDIPIFKALS